MCTGGWAYEHIGDEQMACWGVALYHVDANPILLAVATLALDTIVNPAACASLQSTHPPTSRSIAHSHEDQVVHFDHMMLLAMMMGDRPF